jgi:hypothetical protein
MKDDDKVASVALVAETQLETDLESDTAETTESASA